MVAGYGNTAFFVLSKEIKMGKKSEKGEYGVLGAEPLGEGVAEAEAGARGRLSPLGIFYYF